MHACINQDKPVVGILSGWDFVHWDFVLAPYIYIYYIYIYIYIYIILYTFLHSFNILYLLSY